MRLKKLGTLCLLWGMMLLTAGTAFGQIEGYMRIEGISGRFKIDTGLTDWAQISRMPDPYTISISTTQNGGYQQGKVAFTDLSIVKNIDKSTPVLNMACTQGRSFPRITIELYRAEERRKPSYEERRKPFYKIEMTTVFVAGVTPENDIDSKLERVTFKCKRIEWKYGFPKK
jgi:type VI secretion system secreted protein Hcp